MGGVLGKMSHLTLSEDLNIKKGVEKLEDLDVVVNGSLNTPKRNFIADEILDPRSATIGIKRTPLFLTKIDEKREQNETPVKAKPYLETDLDEAVEAEESKIIEGCESDCSRTNSADIEAEVSNLALDEVSNLALDEENSLAREEDNNLAQDEENYLLQDEDNTSQEIDNIDINESLIAEHGSFSTPKEAENDQESDKEDKLPVNRDDTFDDIITFDGKVMSSPAVSKLKKSTLVYEDSSPTSESTPVKSKNGRTPLGLVTNNSSPLPSPLATGKPWRGFHEERIRLGLENTPPNSLTGAFIESVQSAPGKVGARRAKKLTRANWAQDESLII